ncbi:MAG: MarR family transcriptional regulator [Gemmataceae bacterium]|nr:MarR family transcriptional regulator [Gemmataceae bacterium]
MIQEYTSDIELEGWLKTLGIESLCQWDVLLFLYRHQTSLVGADYLASLLGYAIDAVSAALDVLESLRLVERSRVSQGARLYQFIVPAESPRGAAFERLLALADHRAGRLLLAKQLRRGDRRSLGEAQQGARGTPTWSPERTGKRTPWLRAI